MRHFATESGKSKGQFYTPAEVSRIMAKVVGIGAKTRQDQNDLRPNMRLRIAAAQGIATKRLGAVTIYGQEKDLATWALARMNMILHGMRRRDLEGQHAFGPHFTNGAQPQDIRFRCRESAVLREGVEQRLDPENDPSIASSMVFHRRRTATTPFCCTSSSRSRAPARARSSCRMACCSAATPKPKSASRSSSAATSRASSASRQPLLRHGHPGLHRRARQGERPRPYRHLHDRCLQGLHEGRQQEPAPRPGHPQDRRCLQQAGGVDTLFAHGARSRDRQPRNDFNLNIPRYIDSLGT